MHGRLLKRYTIVYFSFNLDMKILAIVKFVINFNISRYFVYQRKCILIIENCAVEKILMSICFN